MIIVKIMGGLGNQMFQYAFAKSMANKLQTEFKLDTSTFRWTESRRFTLPKFNCEIKLADNQDIRTAKQHGIIKEKGFEYSEYDIPSTCYLNGYFQSPKYFENIKRQIINDFTLRDPIRSYSQFVVDDIKNTDSVSLNVRRGDYVTKFSNTYYSYGIDYYMKSMEIIESKVKNPHYFVMSDDIQWVKDNLYFNNKVTFLSKEYGIDKDGNAINKTDYADLSILSMCKYHIIGNSTFAWWGAYLSQSDLVISPREWFKDGRSTNDLLLDDWIQI